MGGCVLCNAQVWAHCKSSDLEPPGSSAHDPYIIRAAIGEETATPPPQRLLFHSAHGLVNLHLYSLTKVRCKSCTYHKVPGTSFPPEKKRLRQPGRPQQINNHQNSGCWSNLSEMSLRNMSYPDSCPIWAKAKVNNCQTSHLFLG